MSKSVSIEIPDEVYRTLEALSKESGKSMALLAAEWVSKYGPRPVASRSQSERSASRAALLRFAGMHRGGEPRASDNSRIDADLAAEHGNTHEPDR